MSINGTVITSDEAVGILTSSKCNLPLAAERLGERIGKTVNEYDLIDAVATDTNAAKRLASNLRVLSVIKLFDMMEAVSFKLTDELDNLKAGDVARLYTSLHATLGTLTTPDTKNVFDFEDEARKISEEFNIPIEEAKAEIRDLMVRRGVK